MENRSRPLACDEDLDCPQFTGTSGTFECRNQICQSTDTVTYPPALVSWAMANTLCYARIARAETIDPRSNASLEVYGWVEGACPSKIDPCTLPLPAGCLTP